MIDNSSDISLKQCPKCEQFLPATPEFFGKDKNRKDGFYPYCRSCKNAVGKRHNYSYVEPSEDTELPVKACTTCANVYPATPEFFSRNRRQIGGLHSYCKKCGTNQVQAWIETHQEQKREMDKQYYVENRDQIREHVMQYYGTHRDQVYETQRRYNISHREVLNRSNRKYQKTERGKIAKRKTKHARRARVLAASGTYTMKQLQEQMTRQKSKCYYCKTKLKTVWHADHVVPLSRGGSNDISNIVIVCPSCNFHKSNKMLHEWNGSGGRLL